MKKRKDNSRDVIEPSTSPWSAQVVLASKKDGSYRYCVDFHRLNSVTVKEHYPVPRVEDMIDILAGAKFGNSSGRQRENSILYQARTLAVETSSIWALQCSTILCASDCKFVSWNDMGRTFGIL